MGGLILHIGTPKTGSSAIQRFLKLNNDLLEGKGLSYPLPLPDYQYRMDEDNAEALGVCAAINKGGADGFTAERARAAANTMSHYSRYFEHFDRTILSDEILFQGIADKGLDYCLGLHDVIEDFGSDVAKIIVYLRRQDHYVGSFWKQHQCTGLHPLRFEEYIAFRHIRSSLDYSTVLSFLEQVFPDSEIVVRCFERERLAGGNIYRDFCEAASIPWDERYQIPQGTINPSINFDVAEALRRAQWLPSYRTEARIKTVIPLALRLSEEEPDPPNTLPFDEAGARAFVGQYAEGNRRISQRYLNGESLFTDDYELNTWIPNETRIRRYINCFWKELFEQNPSHAILRRVPGRRAIAEAMRRILPEDSFAAVKRALGF